MLAVLAEKHRPRTFRAVEDGDDGTRLNFGNAAAWVEQLGAAARFGSMRRSPSRASAPLATRLKPSPWLIRTCP